MEEKRMKKALMIASMASMLDNFNTANIELLRELGYEVTLAANFEREDSNSRERVQNFKCRMQERYRIEQIDFTRKLLNIKGQIKSYRQIKKLTDKEFSLIHCHSPICAAMTRMAFRRKRKTGTKVIYTAHGFHFYKGAPLKNWLFFFPVEWICSHWTDVLVTINREDYACAKRYLRAKEVRYIPGVGVDLERFQSAQVDRRAKREELKLDPNNVMMLSVGELSKRKNQSMILNVLKQIKDFKVKYIICGIGDMEINLRRMIRNLQLEERVYLLGYRNDIEELCQAADIFVFPSLQEGLPVALIEAMASGLPVVCSKIRGNMDLIVEGKGGFLCRVDNQDDFVKAITKICEDKKMIKEMGDFNKARVKKFSRLDVEKKMRKIYESV